MKRPKKEDVKAVWEIAEMFNPFIFINGERIVIGGGRGEAPKTTWEEAYENQLKNIC